MHRNAETNRQGSFFLALVLLAATAPQAGCKDDSCQKLENIKWTCASRYCQAGGATTALCFCWDHDMALGGWTGASCQDMKDNDGDGFTDCDDADCRRSEACNCNNGEDDDGNGLTDCEDVQCANSAWCCSQAERAAACCTDGIDNDGDGLTDCESDPDCALACCSDGMDNDEDGLTDCDDPDCAASPDCCGPSAEACACDDGADNDEDGLTDCDDPDCTGNEICFDPATSRFSERIPYCIDQITMMDQSCDSSRADDQLTDFDCPDYEQRAESGLIGKLKVKGFLQRIYNPTTGKLQLEQTPNLPLIHGLDDNGQEKTLEWIRFYDNGWFDSNISKGVWLLRKAGGLTTGKISIQFLNAACLSAPDFCDPSAVASWRHSQDGGIMAYELDEVGEGKKLLLGRWSNSEERTFEAVVLEHEAQ